MKKERKSAPPYTFKDLLVGYIFAMLGFFGGIYIATFLLSIVGLKGKSEALWMGLSLIVGLIGSLLITVRTESANQTLRTGYHKAVDEGREREVTSIGALIRGFRPLIGLVAAILAALLMLIPRGAVEDDLLFVLITSLLAVPLIIALRLPAMIIARKLWAKEHIQKE